jgi:hypothetical protein
MPAAGQHEFQPFIQDPLARAHVLTYIELELDKLRLSVGSAGRTDPADRLWIKAAIDQLLKARTDLCQSPQVPTAGPASSPATLRSSAD